VPRELPFAIAADVLEEEIAEGEMGHAFAFRAGDELRDRLLVDGVGARPRNRDGVQRRIGGAGLGVEELGAHLVHRHAPGVLVDRGEQSGDFDVAAAAQKVRRPGAVLAARPRHHHALRHGEPKGARSGFYLENPDYERGISRWTHASAALSNARHLQRRHL
jgi:hypothetical protein